MRPLLGILMLLALGAPASAGVPAAPPVGHDPVLLPAGPARGVVLIFHGGAWVAAGEGMLALTRPEARGLAAAGWIAHNLDYRPGARGLTDVVAAVRWARSRYPRKRLCLYGESAGGHLALVAASRVGGVACVVAQGAPTDLVRWTSDDARTSGMAVHARATFGRAAGTLANPMWLARHHRLDATRVSLQHLAEDPMVELAQPQRFCRAHPACTVETIAPGETPFTHGLGDARSIGAAWQRSLGIMRGG
jgi:acetyl esterase/lipase